MIEDKPMLRLPVSRSPNFCGHGHTSHGPSRGPSAHGPVPWGRPGSIPAMVARRSSSSGRPKAGPVGRYSRSGGIQRNFVIGTLIVLLAAMPMLRPAAAADDSKCPAKLSVLWGDNRHDDTAALNAWFRGDPVVWAQTGRSVGPEISGHMFRLSAPIYISSGTGRRIDGFQFVWSDHKELVAGGTIVAGTDPNAAPVATGLTKIGAGPNEGVPFHSPTPKPANPDRDTSCLVS